MFKKSSLIFLTIACSALVLMGMGAWTPLAAQTSESGGFSENPLPPDLESDDVPPPDYLDGEVELNPVSEDALIQLAQDYGPAQIPDEGTQASAKATIFATVFRKYAYLPLSTFTWTGGIDHLAAGTGLRNDAASTIRFRGTPPGATAVSAFLYFGFIDNSPVANPLPVTFNGTLVNAFLINTAPSPCWGAGTFRAYRAPVLPYLLPGINGNYTVSGVPSNLANGQNPWNPVNSTPPLAEGASLVVLYTHSSIPRGSQVQIHHPTVTQVYGTTTYTHFLNLPIQVAAMKHTRLGADGQVGGGTLNYSFITNERTSLAGPIPAPFVQIRGNGSYGNGNEDSDWNGTDGEPLNQLWDTHTMDIPGVIAPGPTVTNYRIRYQMGNDCVIPVADVLTYR